jgi:hypothetical protein
MSEWPLFHITTVCLLYAMALQVLSAFLAVRVLFLARNRRLPWAAFCLGLVLMIPQCWRPLELALNTGLYDFYQALLALFIALLMLVAVMGLAPLLPPANPRKKISD